MGRESNVWASSAPELGQVPGAKGARSNLAALQRQLLCKEQQASGHCLQMPR